MPLRRNAARVVAGSITIDPTRAAVPTATSTIAISECSLPMPTAAASRATAKPASLKRIQR